jgi:hypothetical protein
MSRDERMAVYSAFHSGTYQFMSHIPVISGASEVIYAGLGVDTSATRAIAIPKVFKIAPAKLRVSVSVPQHPLPHIQHIYIC